MPAERSVALRDSETVVVAPGATSMAGSAVFVVTQSSTMPWLPAETVTYGYDALRQPNRVEGLSTYVTDARYSKLGETLQYELSTGPRTTWLTVNRLGLSEFLRDEAPGELQGGGHQVQHPVDVETEPLEIRHHAPDRIRHQPRPIGVLDAEEELAAVMPRQQPREQHRANAAKVKEPRRAGSKARANLGHGSSRLAYGRRITAERNGQSQNHERFRLSFR